MSDATLADLYAPHWISSRPTDELCTWQLLVNDDLPTDCAWLEFLLMSVPGVKHVSFEGRVIMVAHQSDHSWERIFPRLRDHVIGVLRWTSSDTVVNGKRLGWDDFPGVCML